jgi:hypothetical protein
MNELLASIVYVYFKEAVPANFEASSEYPPCLSQHRIQVSLSELDHPRLARYLHNFREDHVDPEGYVQIEPRQRCERAGES